ncbi:MAG: sulfite exporter TauE/SafE family protein [Robiginitomaculum sp.]
MKAALIVLFFITALLYASVGFGGGSTYTALLAISGANYLIIPTISLACNILVVSSNSVHYFRVGLISLPKVWPFLVLSVPLAWVGGRIPINETYFIGLLALSLFFAGISMLRKTKAETHPSSKSNALWTNTIIGGGLGLLSGIVGIGGGIFLAPILHFTKWGKVREIAALCSLFILVNSLSGLWGQLTKLGDLDLLVQAKSYWLLLPAVLVGGFIGNRLSLKLFSENTVRKLTALLVLFVAVRLLFKFCRLTFT